MESQIVSYSPLPYRRGGHGIGENFQYIMETSKPWSPEKILYLVGENKPIFRYFLAT